MGYIRLITVSFLFIFSFISCEVINPKEDIPSYLNIEEVQFQTDVSQGENSHKIVDTWIYIDGNHQGVYELPVTFPVLETGTHEVMIRAGIKMNGITKSREIYPFYTSFITNIDLKPSAIDTILPIFKYLSEINFSSLWVEDFEDAGLSIDTVMSSLANIIQIDDTIIDSKIGYIELVDSSNYFECKSTPIQLPKDGRRIYLEMDYYCNQEFALGIWANYGTTLAKESVFVANSTEGIWNKIYIDLTNIIPNHSNALEFLLYITSYKSEDITKGEIGFDNLKIIHFE